MEKHVVDRSADGRFFYIDFLRVAAIVMMFIFHVNMIFVAEWDWHIKNVSQSNVLMEVNYWMAFFRMPLLFFVSGFISCILLEKWSSRKFIAERFNRLILPTVIWTFVLVAPQIYFERKLQGAEYSYIEFYSTFLEFKWWPEGNFHWLHLWFIPYLFVYNLLSIPVLYVIQRVGVKFPAAMSSKSVSYLICLFVTVAVIPYIWLSVNYPVTYDLIHDYARHAQFFPFVVAGLLAYKFKVIADFLEEKRAVFLRLAFLAIVLINVVRWNGWEPRYLWDDWLSHPASYLFLILLSVNSWFWVMALLGYGKRYLNRGSSVLSYCNRAVYPFYILHQTVIVVLGYYVVQTADSDAFKYVFLLVACFIISAAIYHLYIHPFKVVRFLFGAK
ncbi:acyltransferase family protein [Simiduia aestuariiviva]|uniref:Peptidoglycan/LPS O-acetylase OafA/YrhL n=1 Tax=Simiduia aestuariiviva TaxID=1510459 RepID=A0A839UNH1_9GAMM|nr:acyltransferase family protein [Simiduia aestuariiviva]MBB3167118.1 peptidoglycan/LPS O-acetylase OafA/YrhL [Simiduia aestuariiviva]